MNSTADARGGTNLPEYTLIEDPEERGIETGQCTAILHAADEDYWDVEILLASSIELHLKGQPTEPPSHWMVHSASWWLDRRTPVELDDVDLYVGKLQEYDIVSDAIKCLVHEYHRP